MAKRTVHTLSAEQARLLPDALRRLAVGPSLATTPYGSGRPADCWLKIEDWDGSPSENTYTVKVFDHPYAGTELFTEGQVAWNVWEKGMTAEGGCGYDFTPEGDAVCGDIIGVEPLPRGIRYKSLGYFYREDEEKWGWLFSERPDPKINLDCDDE